MNLYLLSIREDAYNELHEYDEVRAAVVCAESAEDARKLLAESRAGDRNAYGWLQPGLTSMTRLGEARVTSRRRIILLDIHEG